MQIAEFLSHFPDARKSGRGYVARCPAHDDRKPSLSISENTEAGRILICCNSAKCSAKEILAAMGLTLKALYTRERDNARQGGAQGRRDGLNLVAAYDYTDENGNYLKTALRYDVIEKGVKTGKQFRQGVRQPDGRYKWGVKGIPNLPYNLPAVLRGIAEGATVYIVEGEKDADALIAQGLVATCNAQGAGQWTEAHSEKLEGADSVLIPDNDPDGYRHVRDIAATLQDKAKRLRLLPLFLPNETAKGDYSDWRYQGGTKERFLQLVADAPEYDESVDSLIALRSREFSVVHCANIEVPSSYSSEASWKEKGEELKNGYRASQKAYELGIARWYNANVKGMEHGKKLNALKQIYGEDGVGTILNFIGAVKRFDREGIIIPHAMPKTQAMQIAANRVPADVMREVVSEFKSGKITTCKQIDAYLKEKGCAPEPKKVEGAKYLEGVAGITGQLVPLAQSIEENGSANLQAWNELYLSMPPETLEQVLKLVRPAVALGAAQGAEIQSKAVAFVANILTQATLTGEICFPDPDTIAVEDYTESPPVFHGNVEFAATEEAYQADESEEREPAIFHGNVEFEGDDTSRSYKYVGNEPPSYVSFKGVEFSAPNESDGLPNIRAEQVGAFLQRMTEKYPELNSDAILPPPAALAVVKERPPNPLPPSLFDDDEESLPYEEGSLPLFDVSPTTRYPSQGASYGLDCFTH